MPSPVPTASHWNNADPKPPQGFWHRGPRRQDPGEAAPQVSPRSGSGGPGAHPAPEDGWGRRVLRCTSRREAHWILPSTREPPQPAIPQPRTLVGAPPGKAVRPARDGSKPTAPLLRRPEGGSQAASCPERDRKGPSLPGTQKAACGCSQLGLRRSESWPGRAAPRRREAPIPSLGQSHPCVCSRYPELPSGSAERLCLLAGCLCPSLGLDRR